jgi:plasmid stabilization system protein ParE
MTSARWKVRLRTITKSDLAEAVAWYKKEAPGQVSRFRDEYKKAIQLIGLRPQMFPERVGELRCYTMQVFPYGIWYLMDTPTMTVHVFAILHYKRDPATLTFRVE